MVVLSGCSLFQPTEPEPPSGAVVIADYSSPEKTLETVAAAVTSKGLANGQSAYEDALADDDGLPGFRAFHLPEVIARQPAGSVPATWDKGRERNFYFSMVNVSANEYEMRFQVDPRNADFEFIDVAADTASLYRQYTVFVFDSDGNAETLALGYANFGFRRINSRWQIIRWTDVLGLPGDDDALTFGALRLEL
jgi:hypothetical protein